MPFDIELMANDHQLALNNILTIPLVLDIATAKDFNDSHFSTSINFSLTQFTSIRHLDYSLYSNQNISVNFTDIGIIQIQPTQVTATADQWTQNVYQFQIYADVLLMNYGNIVLNDCRINHYVGQSIACGSNFYTEHFSNLNLAPNDSMWVSLGLIHSEENYFPNDTISSEICVYTSHPNFKTDLNVPNDEFCETVVIGYADLSELKTDELNLYPNPAKTSISIELSNADNLKFSIFNMQGVQIMKGNMDLMKIDVSTLSKGMYVLSLTSKDGLINHEKHFIKE